jgi:hypothetical protein
VRIVNNKIFIARGETPTYSASIIDRLTGAPLVIDKGLYEITDEDKKVNTVVLEFVVRDSAYSRDDDFRIKYNLLIENNPEFHVFDSAKILEYSDISGGQNDFWDDDKVHPEPGYENYLYHRIDSDDNNFYAYYVDGHWKEYSFDFDVTFRYSETSVMEPKTYKYEVTLLGGALKDNPEPTETIVDVVYKKPILDLTDFVVEGSFSG